MFPALAGGFFTASVTWDANTYSIGRLNISQENRKAQPSTQTRPAAQRAGNGKTKQQQAGPTGLLVWEGGRGCWWLSCGTRGIKSSFCERRGLSWTSCGQMFCIIHFRTCNLCPFLPDSCFILLALGSQIPGVCGSMAYLFLPLPRASRKELSTRSKMRDRLSLSPLLLHNQFLFFFFHIYLFDCTKS